MTASMLDNSFLIIFHECIHYVLLALNCKDEIIYPFILANQLFVIRPLQNRVDQPESFLLSVLFRFLLDEKETFHVRFVTNLIHSW